MIKEICQLKEWLFLLASRKTTYTAASISSSHVAVFMAIFLCEDDVTSVLLTYCRSGRLVVKKKSVTTTIIFDIFVSIYIFYLCGIMSLLHDV